MPRPLRIEYENAWYHVMNRGLNHQKIFKTNEHRKMFLTLLGEIFQKFKIKIHAYCLLDNHYHLLACTPLGNLGRVMRHLDGVYTQKFNRSEKKDGPLFKGRYKAILVESDNYLLQLSRYIHLNPSKARICQNPYSYRWSSLQFYTKRKNPPQWLQTDIILNYFNKENSFDDYKKFVADGIDKETEAFYNQKNFPSILGTKNFIKNVLAKIKEKHKIPCSSDIKRTTPITEMEEIFKIVINYFQIDQSALQAKTPGRRNLAKMIAIYLASNIGQCTHSNIAAHFNLCSESIGVTLQRCNELLINSFEFKNHIDLLIQKLVE